MTEYLVPDPGLQVERTGLAWVRTSAAVGVVGLLLLRWLPAYGPLVMMPSMVAFAVAAWLRVTARSNYRWGLAAASHGDAASPAAGKGAVPPDRHDTLALQTRAHPGRVLLLLFGVLTLAASGMWVMLAPG